MKNISIILILLLITIPGIAKVNSTPSSEVENSGHFQTVWSGNGINHMNINIVEATLSGFNLKAGDEIAAFDGSLCVGVVRLTAPFTSSSIAASQSTDGLPNGYTIGHPITLKFWDAANNKERSPVDIFNSSQQPISPIFSDKGSVSVRLSAKTELTIQITPDNKTYDGTTDATVPNASVVLTNLIAGHNVGATISNAKFDTKNAGTGKTVTADVTLTGTDAAYYSCNATVSSTANILAKAITLTADSKNKTYGETEPALTVRLTSGSIISGDVASGALTRVSGTNAGTYAINKGTYSYGSNYAETFVSANLTIDKKTITVTAEAKNKVFGNTDPELTYTVSPALIGTDTFMGSLNRAVGENVGTYSINKNNLTLSNNYSLTFIGASLTITTKSINVTADAKSKIFRDVDPVLTYTFTPALVGTDTFTGSLSRTPGESVGSYLINKNDLALNGNYTIYYTGANFNIGYQVINVTADSKTKTYGDNDPTLTYTYFPALSGNDSFTGSLSRATGENVGSYTINKNDLALNGNYTINYVSANLTIDPKTINVTAEAKDKTYGDADPALTYTYTPTLSGNDSFTGSLDRTAGENAGKYDITLGKLALSSNYKISFTAEKLTIGAKTITITADAKSKIYGDSDPVFTYKYTPDLIGTDSFTGSLSRISGETVGTYSINKNNLALNSNYILNYTGANLTIGVKTINVTVDGKSKTFGDIEPVLTYTYNPYLIGNDTFTGSLSRTSGEDVGSYSINKNDLSLNSNYSLNYSGANLTIGAKTIFVTATTKSKTYGDADPALTYTYTPALISSDNFTGSLSRTSGENVGTYTINKNDLALSSNYTLNYTGANLTIGVKGINVIADAKHKIYGDMDPALTYSCSSTLIGNDNFTGALGRTLGDNVGEYNITIGTLALNNNYTLIFTSNKLTIDTKTITVTAEPKSKTYGDAEPILTYTYTPALIGTDTFTGSLSRTVGENAGTYTINKNNLTLNNNYALSYASANFTIEPKLIKIITDSKSKIYGEADPVFTYTIDPILIGNDQITGQIGRTIGEKTGTYTFTEGTLSAGTNYNLKIITSPPFTITAKNLTVTGAVAQNKNYDGNNTAKITGAQLIGVVGSDDVTLANHTTGIFAKSGVGTNIAVSTLPMTLIGKDITNYTLTQPTGLKANITSEIPIANAGLYQLVDEGSPVFLDGSGSFVPEGNTISYLWSAPEGIILNSNTVQKPSFVAPEVEVDQTFVFSLVVNDGIQNSAPNQVFITVKQVNKAPIANAGSDQIIEENTKVRLSGLKSTDHEGKPLVYTWVIPPGITVADNNVANIEFVAPEVTDQRSFTFILIVSDGYLIQRDEIIVTVHNVNKKPIANAGIAQTVKEGTTVVLDGSKSSDPDGNTLSYSWIEPASIQLAGKFTANPKFVAPEVMSNGTYLFKLIVSDGLATDETTVLITVENVNKAPIANAGVNQSVKAGNLVQLDGSLSKDPDNDNISYLWTAPNGITLSSPTSAKPSFTAPTITADKDYILTLIVNDGKLNSIADSIIVTVNYENAKPVAINQQVSLNEDDQTLVELKATDDKPVSGLTFKITKSPLNGSLTHVFQNYFAYKPEINYSGSDKFEFEVKDEDGKTDIGTVIFEVKPVNDKPSIILSTTNFPLEQGTSVNVQLIMDDSNDLLNAADMKLLVATPPVSGNLSGTVEKGSFIYTPHLSFSGVDFMQVEAQETNTIEGLKSSIYTIFFNVDKKNQAPVAFDQHFTIHEDSIISFNLPGTDPEDGITGLTYTISKAPIHGQIQFVTENEIKFTPQQDYFGNDELQYIIKDKEGIGSSTAKITFNITPINDRPTALSSEFSAENKDSIIIDMAPLIADVETSDNLLKIDFQLGKGILGGTITKVSGTTYKYKKATNTKSYDYLLYKVLDENLSSYAKVVNIKDIGHLKSAEIIEGIQPIAVNDTLNVWYNKPLTVEFIGIDPIEPYEKLKIELVTQPKNGKITGLAFQSYDKSILTTYRGIYTATENKTKLDSVEYKVSGIDGQSIGKLYFKVHASDIAPKLQAIANQTINEDAEGRVIVVVDDPDTELTSMYWEVKNAKATGFQLNMTIIDGKETFIVTPPLNYHGTSQINIIVTDQKQLKDSVQFMLTVKPINDGPTLISEKTLTVNEDEPFELTLMGNDVDGDAVEFGISNLPETSNLKKGTINNAILFGTLGNDMVGVHKLNLILTDGRINTPITLTLNVLNTDDAPYLKKPIDNVTTYRNGASKTIDLSNYFTDDDLGSVCTYTVFLNSNNSVVTSQITGNDLKLIFSTENIGVSQLIIVVTSDGKVAQASFNVEVLMNTGINDLTSDVAVEVFPNPTKGNVNIQFTELPQKGTRINILDMAGRLIRTQAANSDKEFIDLQGNKSGVYFIQIKNEQHAKTYKIILE